MRSARHHAPTRKDEQRHFLLAAARPAERHGGRDKAHRAPCGGNRSAEDAVRTHERKQSAVPTRHPGYDRCLRDRWRVPRGRIRITANSDADRRGRKGSTRRGSARSARGATSPRRISPARDARVERGGVLKALEPPAVARPRQISAPPVFHSALSHAETRGAWESTYRHVLTKARRNGQRHAMAREAAVRSVALTRPVVSGRARLAPRRA